MCKNSGEMLKVRRDAPRLETLAPTRSTFETRMTLGPKPVRIQPPVETYPKLNFSSSSEFDTSLKLTAPVPPSRTSSRATTEQGSEQSSSTLQDGVNPLLARFSEPPPYEPLHNISIHDHDVGELSEEDSESERRERTISDISIASPEEVAACEAIEQQREAARHPELPYCCSSSEFESVLNLTAPVVPVVASRSISLEVGRSEQVVFCPLVVESLSPIETSNEAAPSAPRFSDHPPYDSLKEMSFPSLVQDITEQNMNHSENSVEPEKPICYLPLIPLVEQTEAEEPKPSNDAICQEVSGQPAENEVDPTEGVPCDNSERDKEQSLSELSKKLIEEACLITEEGQNMESEESSEANQDRENWSDLSINKEVPTELCHVSLDKNQDYLSLKSNSMNATTTVDGVQEKVKYVHQPPDNEEHVALEDSELPRKDVAEFIEEPASEPEQYDSMYTLSNRDKELIEENNHFFQSGQDSVLPHTNMLTSWSQMLHGEGQVPSAPVMESVRASESEMKEVEDYLNEFDSLVGDYDLVDVNECKDEQPPETM